MDNDKTWTPPIREALWLTAPLTLEALCEVLQEALNVPPFEFDAENVYEWGISFLERGSAPVHQPSSCTRPLSSLYASPGSSRNA